MQGSQAEELEQQPESSSHDRAETQGRGTDAIHQEQQGSADENQWLYRVVVS
jgi:hypothetical protein